MAGAGAEAEVREFIRRDTASVRRMPDANEFALGNVGNMNALVQRVTGSSLAELDNVITDLQKLREFLHGEGERVQREIAAYTHLTQAAMTSMKSIAGSMDQWKHAMATFRGER